MMTKKDILFNGVKVATLDATGNNFEDIKTAKNILKDKNLFKEISTHSSIYSQANCFAKVANDLYQNDLKISPLNAFSISPFVVNATFCIELYFKAIHNAYGNKIKGHHLASLYKEMPIKGKQHFLNAANDIRNHYCLNDGVDIHTCLESLNKAFENWRYMYEHNSLSLELQSIRYLMHTAHEAYCRVKENIVPVS